MADAKLQAEINEAVKKLYRISGRTRNTAKPALRRAAKPIVQAAKDRAPKSDAPHYRYKDGRIVATYYPGNLRRSIRVLPLRRTAKAAVLIGPKLAASSGGATGDFKGNRVDAYYATMVEFGTVNQRPQPYMRPAAETAGPQALQLAVRELKAEIEKQARAVAV